MIDLIFHYLEKSNDFLWGHVNFFLIVILGALFSYFSRFFHIRKLPQILKVLFTVWQNKAPSSDTVGLNPLRTFFAGIGGCLGIGNTVAICTAVQLGGPGALFWVWVAGILGMLLKYSEVYLGMIHRVKNGKNGFNGGPMYYLQKAFKKPWIPSVAALLLCVYGVEVYMFNVMVDSCYYNWHISKFYIIPILLLFTFFTAAGGVKRVGQICARVVPIFLVLYVGMSIYVIGSHIDHLPAVFAQIFAGAFTPQAATGAFAGSTVLLTISLGMSRGCYSSDIGVGYASVIHAESSHDKPTHQASLAIVAMFLDIFIVCTLSIMLVLVTSTWKNPSETYLMVQNALGTSFPYMQFFMPSFLLLLGCSAISTYFTVGLKCAEYLSNRKGKALYYLYAFITFTSYSFFHSSHALTLMSLSGAFLLILNLCGIYILRKQIVFELEKA